MIRYLCISVTFLDPLFHGKGDADEPEWPPSPMRLFQALVAGSRRGCCNGDWSKAKAEAYQWLEGREPPMIIAPPARRSAAYTLFVPNNDADEKFDRQDRLAPKMVRTHRIVGGASDAKSGQTLHYVWTVPETEGSEARTYAELLCREARRLTTLGWGVDQAVAHGRVLNDAEVEALSGQRWTAWDAWFAGRQILRAPKTGSLDDLTRAYEAFVNRLSMTQPPKAREPRVFDRAVYLPQGVLPPRPRAAFELPDGIAFRQEDAARIASMLRSLACAASKADTHEFPGGAEVYVAGHVGKRQDNVPRFSYLPLPSIGQEHADGMIRRLTIAEPVGGDGSHARWAQQRLLNAVIRDQEGNERGVLRELWRQSSRAMIRRYVEQARIWSSVTPVILSGFDDSKQTKAEKLVISAVEHAGLPVSAIAELTLRKAPFWPGSQHPRQYALPSYLKGLPSWHLRIVFREPIPGPLAIGAGRHAGLGLFATRET